jgi:NAD(P)-dependent dehydrogenase (short-subunit alcohol dehydrogenase family)
MTASRPGAARVAVVVGASRGIGRATAVQLARSGYGTVFLSYRSDDASAQAAASEVTAAGAEAIAVRGDVTSSAALAVLAGQVDQRGGGLHALVYSVGYRVLTPAGSLDEASWSRALDVSLTGFVQTVQELSRRMAAGGKVVGVSGLSGLRAYSDQHLAMGTAKAASHHAMRYLAWNLAQRQVNVNMACFGSVRTEGVERDLTPAQYEELITAAADRNPLGRLPTTEEAARVIGFLCSAGADPIVGQVIVVDAGETLR